MTHGAYVTYRACGAYGTLETNYLKQPSSIGKKAKNINLQSFNP
jgi:hypothetical protein